MQDMNRVNLVARLTRDPELRSTGGGTSVASLRVAFTTSRKSGDEWEDKSNFIDVSVWGRRGETCAEYLSKGSRVAIDGRLEWRQWERKDKTTAQAIDIVADSVQFLETKGEPNRRRDEDDADVDWGSDPEPVPTLRPSSDDDDIPF